MFYTTLKTRLIPFSTESDIELFLQKNLALPTLLVYFPLIVEQPCIQRKFFFLILNFKKSKLSFEYLFLKATDLLVNNPK